MHRNLLVAAIPIALVLSASEAPAQQSRCADCHLANPDAPDAGHLLEWERSAHGRAGVGCDSCHGGNPSTFERLDAHRNLLGPGNPASPVHRERLPATCGGCHPGPFVAFQRSRHFALLDEGDTAVPVCTSCHGEVAADLLSPRSLEARCVRCHRAGGVAPEHAPLAAEARRLLEGVRQVRDLVRQAEPAIRRVRDQERRARLEADLEQARVPLQEAVASGHAFVFDRLEPRLELARSRAEAVLEALANPVSE